MVVWTNARIDQLGNRLRCGDLSVETLTQLDAYRASFFPAYEGVVNKLQGQLGWTLTGRPAKSTTALLDKLARQKVRLSQVQDIAGCRVVVDDFFLQERALLAMDVYLDSPIVYDRRVRSSHGYRAVHLVAAINGRKVEIQLRTQLQHLWAEISEKISDTVDPQIKYGVGNPVALRFLSRFSDAIRRVELEEEARRKVMFDLHGRGLLNTQNGKRKLREIEKRYFEKRKHLLQLLQDVERDMTRQVAA
ncbi:MAG TPA: hypothetical protein VJ806_16600 [Luteimonas sp.]|nr:hypothetical protein [Luteimonas sp.]